jgi:hypothetical protein
MRPPEKAWKVRREWPASCQPLFIPRLIAYRSRLAVFIPCLIAFRYEDTVFRAPAARALEQSRNLFVYSEHL